MRRSGCSDDGDNLLAMYRYRGQVASAIRGKRGQAFLKEMRDSLLALPEKSLAADSMAFIGCANHPDGEVCAIGSLALRRKMMEGQTRAQAISELVEEWRMDDDADGCGDSVAAKFDIASQLASEVMDINDECYSRERDRGKNRYEYVLRWVNENIKREAMEA